MTKFNSNIKLTNLVSSIKQCDQSYSYLNNNLQIHYHLVNIMLPLSYCIQLITRFVYLWSPLRNISITKAFSPCNL